jgi:hypothetical protein
MDIVRIDCGTCQVRGPACGDCMITALMGTVDGGVVELDAAEQGALRAMTGAGLLPPLRLVRAVGPPRAAAGEEDWFAMNRGVL